MLRWILASLKTLNTSDSFSDHTDPFDRMLIARAISEDLNVMTADPQFERRPQKCCSRVYGEIMSTRNDELATIYSSSAVTAEIEVETIQGLLESSGVRAIVGGLDVLPGAHEVTIQVPAEQKELAERLIAEAQQAGPEAAEEAERASEEPQRS